MSEGPTPPVVDDAPARTDAAAEAEADARVGAADLQAQAALELAREDRAFLKLAVGLLRELRRLDSAEDDAEEEGAYPPKKRRAGRTAWARDRAYIAVCERVVRACHRDEPAGPP